MNTPKQLQPAFILIRTILTGVEFLFLLDSDRIESKRIKSSTLRLLKRQKKAEFL